MTVTTSAAKQTNGKSNGKTPTWNAAQVALVSELLQRLDFAKRAGLQYESLRDIATVAGYKQTPVFADYLARYERQDIAGQIIDIPCETTWRKPPEIVEPDQESTAFTEAFETLAKRLRLWHRFDRTDRLAGIGRYAVILIGTKGTDRDMANEMGALSGPDDVLYLATYSELAAPVAEWDTDPASERFGLPLRYEIDPARGNAEFARSGVRAQKLRVHHSRLIHVAEDLLEDEVYGRPRLRRVLNRLMDLEKIVAASGESFWQLAVRILQTKLDPETQASTEQLAALEEQLGEIVHDLRRHVQIKGGELSWLPAEIADPKSSSDVVMTLIASACGIPKRMLFGSETGERASSEDQKSWLGSIASRQQIFAEPVMVRAFIDRLHRYNGLPKPVSKEDGYEVVWPPLFEVDEETKARTNNLIADTAVKLTPIGGDPIEQVGIEDDGTVYLVPRPAPPPRPIEEIQEPVAPVPPVGSPGDGNTDGNADDTAADDEPAAA